MKPGTSLLPLQVCSECGSSRMTMSQFFGKIHCLGHCSAEQTLPIASASASVMSSVSGDVCRPVITSTSFITGTGYDRQQRQTARSEPLLIAQHTSASRSRLQTFMKCMPITSAGLLVAAAIFVIEIELVFVAMMTPGRVTEERVEKIFFLRSTFSVAASTTKSTSLSYKTISK